MLRWILAVSLATTITVGAKAADAVKAKAELPEERVRRLETTFIAPCCWQDTVKDHRSEVALQMKAEIRRFVAEGKSDREIIDLYKQRYGARVLVEPEGALFRWLNVIPWIALALAAAGLVLILRKMIRPAPPAGQLPPDSANFADLD